MPSLSAELSAHASALAPDFDLVREVGRGGMGVVYLALDVALDRQVAIKVLPDALAQSPEVRERFLREGRTAAKLSHPNIVPIHRADEMGGVVFLVMGFVDGPSLAERLSVSGALPAIESARILRDVALALDYAHTRGVIHRDVKPENILIDRAGGRALVTDFGIAHLAGTTPLTQTGQVLGTVHYMSPEQATGEPVDGRSDLYSLGVVGFRMLTGRLPFDHAVAMAVAVSHATKPPPAVRDVAPDVPGALAAVIDRCLRKSPADRYGSGAAMSAALEEAIRASAPGPVEATGAALAPPVLTEREKDAVLQLAAELQDATGSHPMERASPRPARDRSARDINDHPTLTSGYKLADVQAAAEEVGIDPAYVASAVARLGISTVPPGRAAGSVPGVGAAGAAGAADGGGVAQAGRSTSRRFLGFPIGVGRTTEVARPLSDADWERLVADLRETFHAAGLVRYDGPFRSWINGNLQVHVEPTAAGHRIRMQTTRANSRSLMQGGLVTMGVAAATMIASAMAGHLGRSAMGIEFMAIVGLGMFGLGAIRLPGWARRRRAQMEEVLARASLPGVPATDTDGNRREGPS